jgi:hypothetical protein
MDLQLIDAAAPLPRQGTHHRSPTTWVDQPPWLISPTVAAAVLRRSRESFSSPGQRTTDQAPA